MADTPTDHLPTRILPLLTPLNQHFWTGGAEGELRILRCRACRQWVHPPKAECPYCQATDLFPEATSGKGSVFTFTINWHPFNPAVRVPIIIAVVELPEQERIRFTTNIVDCDVTEIRIDMPVHVIFEPHGEIWVPLFAPDS